MHHLVTAYFNYRRSLLSKDNLCLGQPTESKSLKGDQEFIVDIGRKNNQQQWKDGNIELGKLSYIFCLMYFI